MSSTNCIDSCHTFKSRNDWMFVMHGSGATLVRSKNTRDFNSRRAKYEYLASKSAVNVRRNADGLNTTPTAHRPPPTVNRQPPTATAHCLPPTARLM